MQQVLIIKNSGWRRDYIGIYVDGLLAWSDKDYGSEYAEYLENLLQAVAASPTPVEVVMQNAPNYIAEGMGLSTPYPATLEVFRQPHLWLPDEA